MKDPALLVYTKDFIEGTAHLEPEEMGVYCRLIFHQHQRGALPGNKKQLARMSGLSPVEFDAIWPAIEDKFTLTDQGYINERCRREIDDRKVKARRKSILATFGNWVKYQDLTTSQVTHLKKIFKTDQFIDIDDDEERKEQITHYLSANLTAERLAERSHIAIVDANANEDNNYKGAKNPKSKIQNPKSLVSSEVRTLADQIATAWSFSEISNANLYIKVCKFIEHIGHDRVKTQFDSYWAYKQKSGELPHSIKNWLGLPPGYEDGAWCEKEWDKALQQNGFNKLFTHDEVIRIHNDGRDGRTMAKDFIRVDEVDDKGIRKWKLI